MAGNGETVKDQTTPAEAELRAVLRRPASSRSEEQWIGADPPVDPRDEVQPEKPAAAAPKRKERDTSAEKRPLSAILAQAGKSALGGGIPGAMAMAVQVVTLMPLRTTMKCACSRWPGERAEGLTRVARRSWERTETNRSVRGLMRMVRTTD